MPPPRLASVGYLNARPLVRGLTQGPYAGHYVISEASPAVCADRLRSGEVEVGLIPSIEFQRIPGLRVLPEVCIASKTRSQSVLLISKVILSEVRSVALDASSRTSAALLRILLRRRARNRVDYRPSPPALPAMLEECDAALLIGDPALKADTGAHHVYDLASGWYEMTGLPFVFAFWAVRDGVPLPGGVRPFTSSRGIGLASLDAIASEESPRLGLPAAALSEYLRTNLHYRLGPEEIRSLWLFYRLARDAGIIGECRELAFYESVGQREGVARAGGLP